MRPDKYLSHRLKMPLLAAALLGCAAAPAAFAAPHDARESRFPIAIADVEAKAASRFEAMDTNQSGSVDLAEFEAAPSPQRGKRGPHGMRRHAHRSHTGAMGEGPGQARREAMYAAVEAELFAIMDADGDGAVSEAEFSAGNARENRQLARKRAMFKQLDTDDDNLLTAEEFPNPAVRLRAADADGDGLVSRDEMRSQWQTKRQAHRAQQAG